MNELRIGVVGIPGKWSTEVLADALQKRTGFRLVVSMADVCADLASGKLMAGGVDLCGLDGLIVKKISQQYSPATLDRIELLRLAEYAGVRVFSRTETIIRMIDRLGCTMTLRGGGIPMPETVVTESRVEAMQAIRRFGTAVLKPLYSTKARGMELIDGSLADSDLLDSIDRFQATNPMMYIQQKVDLPGQDLGMVFLGGKYLGTYARVSQGQAWNTTIQSGGRYAAHDPPTSTIELATRAQALFGMDFTTVDVADTKDGPIVFEVSAFGGFRGVHEGMQMDASGLYADYVIGEFNACKDC
ncbi:Alpha-aminoadipate--LysW ligase LysX [Rubripirellula lacrimiformis]|uniref:Alpha-aminoadipate--LysW ligase LysX n=1 Tax=Rubripirellula lacrimiformis TaxID=1930273 RepID=A0A517NA42_9BACT|nr:GAK system ATP-grasp enzyme [Rubripirellula lacrimiformis]QDT04007.1 Alpha-aminoadipate--LysW ligase LysX [Rubripirellula lacrimiformis]